MNRLHIESIFYSGAREALLHIQDILLPYIKGEDSIYAQAIIRLALTDLRSTELFLGYDEIRFRNHQRKGKKLVSAEAYFTEPDNGKEDRHG